MIPLFSVIIGKAVIIGKVIFWIKINFKLVKVLLPKLKLKAF